jgi:thiamine biosynthesis lipoprotein
MSIKRFVSALLTGALCLGVLTACGSAQKPASSGVSADAQRYSTIFYDAFDTVTQVIAYCDSEEEFTRQMDALHTDLLEYHRLYDIYNDYDGVVNVKTINDNAGTAPVQVDDKILGMLELARQMYDTTGGKLNIAMGSVLRIWHDYREAAEANTNEADNKLPEQEALDAAARHCDISNLVIDENARTVYLSDPDMSLDVGSVGKGYAVEMVAQAAEARGLKSALISVGGNLRAIGTKPDGSQWSGGVENPWNASDVYTASSSYVSGVNMSDMALVTSGNYPIDNNGCENSIRPFVIGRRNWLFADTVAGANASANLYSLLETCKVNGIDGYRYLRELLVALPNARTADDYEALLPWRLTPRA